MMRLLRFLLAVVLGLSPILAGPDTEARRSAAADRYLAVTMETTMLKDMFSAMASMDPEAKGTGSGGAEEMLERIDLPLFKKLMKSALMKNFTADELNALASFYSSPTAQSAMKKTPNFFADFLTLVQRNAGDLFRESTDSPDEASPKPHEDPEKGNVFRLGGVAPLTGEAATFGISVKNAMELAISEWNARGGVLGKQIELAFADDMGDPAEGATVYTKLIQIDGVSAIVGPIMSKVALAGAPICQAAEVPMLSPTATNPKVTQVGDYIFRVCFIDPFQGTVGARFAFRNLKAERAACLFDVGNDYTKGLSEHFKDEFIRLGGRLVAFEGHATGESDFQPQLRKILARKPQVLYVSDYYNDAAIAVKQARALGFKGPVLGGDGWDSPRYVELGGAATENTYFTNHYVQDDTRPAVREFVMRYKARFGQEEPDALAALGYDATNVMLEAVKRAGSPEGPAIRDALRSTRTSTVCGNVRFDEERNPVKPAVIVKLKAGKQVYFTSVEP